MGLFIIILIIPVAKSISIVIFSLIFKIVSIFPTFVRFIVDVLLTGVIIFKSIKQFCKEILNILLFFSA